MLGMTDRKRKVGGSLAAVALVGSLSVGMVAMEARPAEALIPLLAIPILGATAAGTGITVGGALAAAGITAAAVGTALAISQPGAFDWMKDVPDWFAPNTDGSGAPVDTIKNDPYVPIPSREGDADPMFFDYGWTSPNMDVTQTQYLTDGQGPRVRFSYSHIGASGSGMLFGTIWATGTCKNLNDVNQPHVTMSKAIKAGVVQPSSGLRDSYIDVTCAGLGGSAYGSINWVPTQVTASPVTTKQKLTIMTEGANWYADHRWANGTTSWQSKDYVPVNPQYRVEVTCKNMSTGVRQVIASSTDKNSAGMVNIPTCASLGSEWYPESMVVGFADGDTLKQPIFTATPAHPDQFWECDPVFGKTCKFQIFVDGEPCVVGSPACASWAGLQRVNPSRVKCMYGTKEVDISGCAILEGAYIYGGSPSIKTNTDGNPDTWTDPSTVPGWTPHILPTPDPITNPNGNPVPDPNPQPQTPPNPNPAPDITTVQPQPSPSPSPSVSPSPSPGPGTSTPPITGVNPNTNPGGENCLGAMWTWNPIDWVMVPVQCALTWAFVPNPATLQAKGDQIYDKFADIGISAPIDALTGAFDSLPGGGGCAGPTVQFDIRSVHQTIQPFNACDQPMASIAAAANAFGSIYLLVFGSIGVVRTISGAFGYTFSLGAKE